jgi:hypothetical protein
MYEVAEHIAYMRQEDYFIANEWDWDGQNTRSYEYFTGLKELKEWSYKR